ncbi:CIA30 family protein [Aliagarivorans marinus]|uniref:CIA30 family protein n=1 Tax=Aliagarivorans marinus TaxID=561965 RepID=UPI0004793064|nr:CIA30 family protein [Aliagarivorans marinus]
MIDLSAPDEHHRWRATNDGVMGGLSQGELLFDGRWSVFSGELSLSNNGGFSSVNRPIENLPAAIDRVELVFIGDGRRYQLRFATISGGELVRYKHEFATVPGQRHSKLFKLKDFQATFRGRLISDAPSLKAEAINQVGLLIADKQPGPFALELVQLQFLPAP